MKSKICICLAVLGFLIISSLCVLQPVQAQYSYQDDGKLRYASPLYIISPTNITYATNQVCLNFTVKAQFDPNVADVIITYSLDHQSKVTVPITFEFVPLWARSGDDTGFTTTKPSSLFSYYLISGYVDLVDLPQGEHILRVDARYIDYARNDAYYDNALIYFTTDVSPQPTSNLEAPFTPNIDFDDSISESDFPINTVYAFVGVISLITVVSLALFTKRKPKEKM
ncbi:MAG: hypothetical protein LBB87_04605 [Nitrososphaerota archaeon]|jgi:hypothetical protein|nr:hypothetical protein [Nitrososphaerota archaeon]